MNRKNTFVLILAVLAVVTFVSQFVHFESAPALETVSNISVASAWSCKSLTVSVSGSKGIADFSYAASSNEKVELNWGESKESWMGLGKTHSEYTYKNSGTYTVTLSIYNASGNQFVQCPGVTINVHVPTPTPSYTPSPSHTPSHTPTQTKTETKTPTPTPTFTLTNTNTPTPTETKTETNTPTPTVTPTDGTPTQTSTPTETVTTSPTPSATPTITVTPPPDGTPTATPTVNPPVQARPEADSCEVYSDAYRTTGDLYFGIVGTPVDVSHVSGLNKYEPRKRAFTFDHGTLSEGLELFMQNDAIHDVYVAHQDGNKWNCTLKFTKKASSSLVDCRKGELINWGMIIHPNGEGHFRTGCDPEMIMTLSDGRVITWTLTTEYTYFRVTGHGSIKFSMGGKTLSYPNLYVDDGPINIVRE